jgi:hypothetical protein
MEFELLEPLRGIEVIASRRGIHELRRLIKNYGGTSWRKMKGRATVRLRDGTIIDAELHWYEAHGVGRRELKFRKPIR